MLDLIFSGLAEIVGAALDGLIELFMPLLDFNFNTFNSTFPYAAETYSLIQSIAMAIALLIATIQIVPFFFGGSRKNESPIRILISTAVAVAAIYYGNYIFTALMDFAQRPYDALRLSHVSANFGGNLSSIISGATYQVSILLYIILIVAMGIALLKLMLEVIERYVFMFVMIYLSPLASATLASKETSGVFWKFVSMFIAQCTLFVLNIWFLKMVVSMFQNLSQSPFLLLGLVMGYAMLRIAAKFDSYLNQLGLNAAAVGMGNELMAAGMMVLAMGSGKMGNKGIAGSNEKGGILGIADKIAQGFGKISPIAGISQGVGNAIGGLFKSGGQAWGAVMDAARNEKGFKKISSGFAAGTKSFGDTIKGNQLDAWRKTQSGSWYARAVPYIPSDNKNLDLSDVAKNSFIADKVMDSFTGEDITESSDVVAAMSQGVGLDRVDEDAKEMLDVGYGNVNADAMSYKIDGNGIHAQYEKDGWQHDWQVKTAEQYNQLTPQQQQAYTGFKSENGRQYYYTHNRTRAPSQRQKDNDALNSAVEKFAANPAGNPLTVSQFKQVCRDDKMMGMMMDEMKRNNTSLEYVKNPTTPEQKATNEFLANFANNMRFNGVNNRDSSAAAMAISSGTANYAKLDANGFTCHYNASTHEGRCISVLTNNSNHVDSADTDKMGALENSGYVATPIGDTNYYARTETRLTPNDTNVATNDLYS